MYVSNRVYRFCEEQGVSTQNRWFSMIEFNNRSSISLTIQVITFTYLQFVWIYFSGIKKARPKSGLKSSAKTRGSFCRMKSLRTFGANNKNSVINKRKQNLCAIIKLMHNKNRMCYATFCG